jgi:hypothetical protein
MPGIKFDDIDFSQSNSCKNRIFDTKYIILQKIFIFMLINLLIYKRKFTAKYNLTELVAINFVQAQYDDSVPQFIQSLVDCRF